MIVRYKSLLIALVLLPTMPSQASAPLAASKDWNRDNAAHLLRRAGFGGTPKQIDYLVQLGRRGAVEYLVNFDRVPAETIPIQVAYDTLRGPAPANEMSVKQKPGQRRKKQAGQPPPTKTPEQRADSQLQRITDRKQLGRVIRWWIETMVSTPRPLQEKLVLFWHGHFTSGYREVKSSWAMHRQNELFRTNAAGNFRDLLIAITQDPAMVLYLNSQQNRKGKPNENYAREFLELFTIGPGHYTENDIKEAARAFTGIGFELRTGEPVFRRVQHDFGPKTFMGQTGDFGPVDIVDLVLRKKETAEFIARKFWIFFAYEDPEEPIVKALAKVLRDNRYEIKPLLKAMFMSDAFYSDRAKFTHIKSPVELMIGTLRVLEIPAVDTTGMLDALRSLGQDLMQPPNVKGWNGGETWITTSSLFKRYNIVGSIIQGNDTEQGRRARERIIKRLQETLGAEALVDADDLSPLQPQYDPVPVVKAANLRTPEEIVDYYLARLLQRPMSGEQRLILIETFNKQLNKRPVDDPGADNAIRALIHLIVSTPEFQLS